MLRLRLRCGVSLVFLFFEMGEATDFEASTNAGILHYHPSQQAGRGPRFCVQDDNKLRTTTKFRMTANTNYSRGGPSSGLAAMSLGAVGAFGLGSGPASARV